MTANEMADYLESMADDVGHEGYHRYALVLKFEAPQLIRQQQAEIEALHNLVKEQDMKIINLSFDVAYANRRDEWLNETDKQDE